MVHYVKESLSADGECAIIRNRGFLIASPAVFLRLVLRNVIREVLVQKQHLVVKLFNWTTGWV